MPIGIGAAMLIGSAVSGGAAVAGAKLQSNAAKNAAKAQQAGTDRALAVQQQQNAPYMQVGQQAAARLASGQAMGKPYTQQFGGPGGSNGFQAFNPQQQMPPPQGPPQGTLSSLGQAPQGQPPMPQQQQMPPQGPPQGQQGSMVMMEGPDGSRKAVPQAAVQAAMQRGAKVVQ